MRVLSVVPLYPPHHLGGYEVVCRGVMERFCEAGHDVVVLTAAHRLPGVDEASLPQAADVRRVLRGWWDWETHGPSRPSLAERVRVERHNQRMLEAVVSEFRPDVASIWSLVYMSWSLPTQLERRSVPIVLSFGDDWLRFGYQFDAWTRMFERRPWLRPLGRAAGLETGLPSFSGATASVSSRMIAAAIEESAPWKFPDAPLVPMGVETRELPLVEPSVSQWRWQLLYAGRVVKQKGVATLVRALALLPPQARLTIDGRGAAAEVDQLTALAVELGVADRVSFEVSSRSQLAGRYRAADVVVVPSEWAEPFGLVPLEAMACGTPVVATGTGGSGEFLADGVNCLLFPPGDPRALAQAVIRLAGDAGLRRRITAGGSALASEMTMDRYAERLEELHLRAVGTTVPPGMAPAPAGRG